MFLISSHEIVKETNLLAKKTVLSLLRKDTDSNSAPAYLKAIISDNHVPQ